MNSKVKGNEIARPRSQSITSKTEIAKRKRELKEESPEQFEKWEATGFNLEFPENYFQLRAPLLEPLGEALPEPEMVSAGMRLIRGAAAPQSVDLEQDAVGQGANALALITGIADEHDRRWYASIILNRMMFIYFLQGKGFLNNADTAYLQNKLAESKSNKKFLESMNA